VNSRHNSLAHDPGQFRTTHWSIVLTAATGDSTVRHSALSTLCKTYWYPLYAFARRQGRNAEDAEDAVQDYFARLLAKDSLASVRPENGRFRSFLLTSLKNFLANDWDRKHTVKRGGRCDIVSWDSRSAEERYLFEPHHDATPEKLFEQSWAYTAIQSVLDQLRTDYVTAGKDKIFDEIQSYLEEEGANSYAEIGAKLNMTEGAVKMAVVRLRENFRQRLRAEVAQTVADVGEVDEELRHLFACLGT